MAKILVVEDDPTLCQDIASTLKFEKHTVDVADDGTFGWEMLNRYKYDLVVLDWMLPGTTGIEICARYRTAGGATPILMLTGRSAVTDKTQGLDAGADDYLTKPFHTQEFLARVRALLRRPPAMTGEVLQAGNIVLDPKRASVTKSGEPLKLLPKEHSLLEFLMKNPGRIYSADELIDHVWNSDSNATPETVRTYLKTLRKKIGTEGRESMIHTVHGMGYKLEPP